MEAFRVEQIETEVAKRIMLSNQRVAELEATLHEKQQQIETLTARVAELEEMMTQKQSENKELTS